MSILKNGQKITPEDLKNEAVRLLRTVRTKIEENALPEDQSIQLVALIEKFENAVTRGDKKSLVTLQNEARETFYQMYLRLPYGNQSTRLDIGVIESLYKQFSSEFVLQSGLGAAISSLIEFLKKLAAMPSKVGDHLWKSAPFYFAIVVAALTAWFTTTQFFAADYAQIKPKIANEQQQIIELKAAMHPKELAERQRKELQFLQDSIAKTLDVLQSKHIETEKWAEQEKKALSEKLFELQRSLDSLPAVVREKQLNIKKWGEGEINKLEIAIKHLPTDAAKKVRDIQKDILRREAEIKAMDPDHSASVLWTVVLTIVAGLIALSIAAIPAGWIKD